MHQKAQMTFYMDTSRCTGCGACDVACKDWNDIEVGVHWRKVITLESGKYPDVKVFMTTQSCMHCADPPCAKVCPTEAIQKRMKDGIVLIDKDKCIRCFVCLEACPFGVPQFGEDGLAQMCNFCVERVEQGQNPICVDACVMRCLFSGTVQELSNMISSKNAVKLARAAHPSYFTEEG